ncbi:unnamed protein product [Rhodiola kirilowii]
MSDEEVAKLDQFLQWLQVNKVELRCCSIKYCDSDKGFGIYTAADAPEDGVLLVVPLDLAITPMRVLQDPVIGLECRKMFEDGDVDDRFLMILFLTVERLLTNSSWKPYLDMLPTSFGNPLWFTDDEMEELKGTALYRASKQQKKKLQDIFDSKVKKLVKKLLLLQGNTDSEVCFQDFLWANAIFWTRALNIPLPRSYVFPTIEDPENGIPVDTLSVSVTYVEKACGATSDTTNNVQVNEANHDGNGFDDAVRPEFEETVWVEGLVPGIDFCNHSSNEVLAIIEGKLLNITDELYFKGLIVSLVISDEHLFLSSLKTWSNLGSRQKRISNWNSFVMYLLSGDNFFSLINDLRNIPERPKCDIRCMRIFHLYPFVGLWILKYYLSSLAQLKTAEQNPIQIEKEITISYGDKGNEELLYLYGFVIDKNPDDYLMIHYPVESLQSIPYSDAKSELLQAQQNAEMRCLLSRHLLAGGFFPVETSQNDCNNKAAKVSNYSWSGKRRIPSYLSKLVFPEDFLTALRTISMKEEQLYQVSSMLEELVGSEDRQPSETEVRTAVWEACGDSGAFQLLVDLLQTKMMELEEGSGTEDFDTQLLENAQIESTTQPTSETNGSSKQKCITRNTWSAIVYRKGQKHLTRLFLKEAEHALELSLTEEK